MFVNLPKSSATNWIDTINKEGGKRLPKFISESTRKSLLAELHHRNFAEQPKVYGKQSVSQSFSASTDFPVDSIFVELARIAGERISRWFCESRQNIFVLPLNFTDLVIQSYPQGNGGIGVHRDGKSFINLIAVLVIEGEGNFSFCDDRDGSNPRHIQNEPGDLILMRGVGFCGSDHQPFHFVDGIRSQRTTFGMRQKAIVES